MTYSPKISRALRSAIVPFLSLLVLFVDSPGNAKNAPSPPGPAVGYNAPRGGEDKIAGWQYVHKARHHAAKNQNGASIFWYLEAVKRYPPLKAILAREIGYQYARSGDPESAVAWYSICVSQRPDDIEARLGLARALGRSGRLDRALEHYRAVISISDGLPLDLDLEIDKVTASEKE